MGSRQRTKRRRNGERGNSLFIVAGFLFIMLGIGALAIDLASMYVARNESQRAADSAALAGAKVFVESGCVTLGDCTGQEGLATTRATQAALQSLVAGQPVTVQAIGFTETAQNPQITVQIVSANLPLYFAGAVGITSASNVGATATAEAYNPSGAGGGSPIYCTGCVRPWLIPNCDFSNTNAAHLNLNCPAAADYFLDPGTSYGVANPGCVTANGIAGEVIDVRLQTQPTWYGAMDVDTPALGNLADYQQAITTCFTGQTTCGPRNVSVFPIGVATAATTTGVENLLHVAGTGIIGQDTIDTSVCPPQITAGTANPYGANGLIATSDSIVTAFIYDYSPTTALTPGVPQSVNVVGFAQIFVTQADTSNAGDFLGVILNVAGCGSNGGGACDRNAIQSSTMLPVRLISTGN
jgi:hypothetical protein